jgi:transcriptional regulator with XRE-family HTH domain
MGKFIKFLPDISIFQQLRMHLNLSQKDMAKLFGVSQSEISLLENKKRRLKINMANKLIKLASKYDIFISIDELEKDYKGGVHETISENQTSGT